MPRETDGAIRLYLSRRPSTFTFQRRTFQTPLASLSALSSPAQEEFALLKSAMHELAHVPFKFAGLAFEHVVLLLTAAV